MPALVAQSTDAHPTESPPPDAPPPGALSALPPDDRPRERLLRDGAHTLASAELKPLGHVVYMCLRVEQQHGTAHIPTRARDDERAHAIASKSVW